MCALLFYFPISVVQSSACICFVFLLFVFAELNLLILCDDFFPVPILESIARNPTLSNRIIRSY